MVETELVRINTCSTSQKNANTVVTGAPTPLSNSRISRDDAMYATDTGLVDLAALVKKYVKSLYGADSPQFQQITAWNSHVRDD